MVLLMGYQTYAQKNNNKEASYKVTVLDKQKAHVEAQLWLESKLLTMYVLNMEHLPDGQATFVKNLVVKDKKGKTIPHKYLKDGDWEVDTKDTLQMVKIQYDIELRHQEYAWDAGFEEIAYKTDEGVFFVGYSLFIVTGMMPAKVEFVTPKDWKITTSWKSLGKNTFEVPSRRSLLANCIFLGTHQEEIIKIDNFELRMVIGKKYHPAKPLFVNTLSSILKTYLKLFGTPLESSYLAVINEGNITDGGAFMNSYSMTIEGDATAAASIVWSHTMAHEVLHLWNGIAIRSKGQNEWFNEGITEYLTVVMLKRAGIIDNATLFKKLENHYRKYLIAKMIQGINVSIKDSGDEKAKNRLLVYGGGAIFGFALDVEIREATNNQKGLEDLLKKMFDDFAKNGKTYTTEDVIRVSSEVAGKDLKPFFDKNLFGTGMIDHNDYLKRAGLQMHTFIEEIYISPYENATEKAKAIGKQIFQF